LAAASDLYQNDRTNHGVDTNGTAKQSALTTASANGYTNDTTNSVVTVNIPPKKGLFIGKAGYAEVVVRFNQQRGLSNFFGSGTIPVSARAVARGLTSLPTPPGILLLDPTSSGSLTASGNGNVTETGAAVIVDSNNASAAVDKGNGSVTATSVAITGSPGIKDSGNGQLTTTPTSNNISTGVPPTPDPLSYLPVPKPSSLTAGSISQNGSTYTLSPGIYGGLGGPSLPNFNKNDTVIFKQSSAGNGGIYYLAGGGLNSTGANLQMDSNSSGGIMIYNAGTGQKDGISITGNSSGTVNLSPLTSGPYTGMTIFQSSAAPEDLQIAGNGTFNITGTIYAPDATLKITGNGATSNIGSQYISKDLTLSGNGNITIT